MSKKFPTTGFTLVELSIVIVIIGLIVAGVMAGQGLVQQAKLRKATSDFQQYTAAVQAFRLQYDALPGDMANAFSYWSGCGSSDANNCNGNGNGEIDIGGAGNLREDYAAWEHLSLAGLAQGNYTYVADTVIGRNIPAAPFANTGYWLWYGMYLGQAKAVLSIGSDRLVAENYFNSKATTPTQAFAMDSKIDDGVAGRGKFITFRDQNQEATAGICVDQQWCCPSDQHRAAQYILSDSTVSCYSYYIIRGDKR